MSFVSLKTSRKLQTAAEKLQYVADYHDNFNFNFFKLAQTYEATKLKQSLTALVSSDQTTPIYQHLRRTHSQKSNWTLIMDNILNLIDHLFYSSLIYQITELKQINKIIDQLKQKLISNNKYNTIQTKFSGQIKQIMHEFQGKLLSQDKLKMKDKIEQLRLAMSQQLKNVESKNKNEVQVGEFIKSIQEKRLMKAEEYEEMVINKMNETKNVVEKFIKSIDKSGNSFVEEIRNKRNKQISEFKLKVLEEGRNENESENKFKKESLQVKNYKSILKNNKIIKSVRFDNGVEDQFQIKMANVKQFLFQIYPQNRKYIFQKLVIPSSSDSNKLKQNKKQDQNLKLQTIEENVNSQNRTSTQNFTSSEIPTEQTNIQTNQNNQQKSIVSQDSIATLHTKYCTSRNLPPQYNIQNIKSYLDLQFEMYGYKNPINNKNFIINFISEVGYINQKGNVSSFIIYQNVSEEHLPTVIESVKSGKKIIVIDNKDSVVCLVMRKLGHNFIVEISQSRNNNFTEMFKKGYKGITKDKQVNSKNYLQEQLIFYLKEELKLEGQNIGQKYAFQLMTQRVLEKFQDSQ